MYKVLYEGEYVAVKVQRPHAKLTIASDFYLIRSITKLIDYTNILKTNLTSVIDEFASRYFPSLTAYVLISSHAFVFIRIYEELDYVREARNIQEFGNLYRNQVVVPKLYKDLSSENIITMSWVEGSKLLQNSSSSSSELLYITKGIEATLTQLLDVGKSIFKHTHTRIHAFVFISRDRSSARGSSCGEYLKDRGRSTCVHRLRSCSACPNRCAGSPSVFSHTFNREKLHW